MLRALLLALMVLAVPAKETAPVVTDGPSFTADGQLKFPAEYREWVYLTSGLDMTYGPNAPAAAHPVFDNVFVNPSAYRSFLRTGTWPDGTVIMLENRAAVGEVSINKRGKTQSTEVTGLEVHVKDSAHLKGDSWGFFNFKDKVSAKLIDRPASCYTCHEQHAAVNTTFVQFYPTLLPLATEKKTLSEAYLTEMAAPAVIADGKQGSVAR